LEETDVYGRNILYALLKKQEGKVWTRIIWIHRGTSGTFL
jgi:hypothetical protein